MKKLLNIITAIIIRLESYYFKPEDKFSEIIEIEKLFMKTAIKLMRKDAFRLFDISVMMGCHRAGKTLQKVVNRYFGCNLVVDGIVGSGTISKVKELIQTKGEDIFVSNMLLEYGDNVTEASKLEGNAKFLQGWMNRLTNLSNYLRKL